LRPFCVNFSIPNAHLIDPIHQFRDEIEIKTRAAEGFDAALRSNDYLGILDRVIEIIFFHVAKNIERRRAYYNQSGPEG